MEFFGGGNWHTGHYNAAKLVNQLGLECRHPLFLSNPHCTRGRAKMIVRRGRGCGGVRVEQAQKKATINYPTPRRNADGDTPDHCLNVRENCGTLKKFSAKATSETVRLPLCR